MLKQTRDDHSTGFEHVETSSTYAMDFKSISPCRHIALSFGSLLIRRLTIMRVRGWKAMFGDLGLHLPLPVETEKKGDIDIIFGKHDNANPYPTINFS